MVDFFCAALGIFKVLLLKLASFYLCMMHKGKATWWYDIMICMSSWSFFVYFPDLFLLLFSLGSHTDPGRQSMQNWLWVPGIYSFKIQLNFIMFHKPPGYNDLKRLDSLYPQVLYIYLLKKIFLWMPPKCQPSYPLFFIRSELGEKDFKWHVLVCRICFSEWEKCFWWVYRHLKCIWFKCL